MSRGDPAIEEAKEESEERDIEEEKSLAALEEEGEEGEIVLEEEDILPFDPKFLEKTPPKVKRALIEMSIQMMRMGGPAFNPLAAAVAKVLDGEHLTNLIELVDRSTEHEYKALASGRIYQIVCLGIGVAVFVFLIIHLSESNPDLLITLVSFLVGLIGGFGGGIAFESRRKKD